MTKLTEHFTLKELTVTKTGIPNIPKASELDNLKRLAETLEKVRALTKSPITVTSGFRSERVNTAVGGSPTSAHRHGLAADISAKGFTSRQLANLIKDSDIEYDQLILEYPKRANTWVHIGLSKGKNRMEQKTINVGTGYLPGIL